MAEVKIADQNMYGYRTTGVNEPDTRVRVFAGQPIPPDLHSLEPAPELDEQVNHPERLAARLSAEDQQKAQGERNKAVRGTVDAEHNPDVTDERPVNRGTRTERQQRAQQQQQERAKGSAKE